VPITLVRYPIYVRNEGIPTILVGNSYLYNTICPKLVEVLEGNQYNDFKAIPPSFGTRKPIAIDFDAEIPLKLLSKTPFHNIVIIKFVPLDPRGDPLETLGGVTIADVQPIILYSRSLRRPLNYPEYNKYFDLDVHV
jgi:hypothetical protein